MLSRDFSLNNLYNTLMYYHHNPDHAVDHMAIEENCQNIEEDAVGDEKLCNSLIKEIQTLAFEMHKNFEKKEAVYKLLDLKTTVGLDCTTRINNIVFKEERIYQNLYSLKEKLQNKEKLPLDYAFLIHESIGNLVWQTNREGSSNLLVEICALIAKNTSKERLVIVDLLSERLNLEKRVQEDAERNYSFTDSFDIPFILEKCLKVMYQVIYDK